MSSLPFSPNQKFFSIADVADYFRVSTKTVLRWIAAGHLSAFKLGRQWRISREDLKIFANARKKHAVRDVL